MEKIGEIGFQPLDVIHCGSKTRHYTVTIMSSNLNKLSKFFLSKFFHTIVQRGF